MVEDVHQQPDKAPALCQRHHGLLDYSGTPDQQPFGVFVALNDMEKIVDVDCVVDGCRFKGLGSADPCHLIPTQPRRGLLNCMSRSLDAQYLDCYRIQPISCPPYALLTHPLTMVSG